MAHPRQPSSLRLSGIRATRVGPDQTDTSCYFSPTMSSILTYIPAFLLPPSNKTSSKFSRRVYVGIVLGFALSLSSTSLALYLQQRRRAKAARKVSPRPIELRTDEIVQGVVGLIGWFFWDELHILVGEAAAERATRLLGSTSFENHPLTLLPLSAFRQHAFGPDQLSK